MADGPDSPAARPSLRTRAGSNAVRQQLFCYAPGHLIRPGEIRLPKV